MDVLLDNLMEKFPQLTVILVYILNLILTLIISTFIFAAIFKVLPDAKVKWKHVWVGAFVTAILFMTGKFLIAFQGTVASKINTMTIISAGRRDHTFIEADQGADGLIGRACGI